ncbi:MAG: TM0996/MTH895 family glutaredoxin-like protein [Anaerolineales bacterium]|nr:TM0996/MTH895 family glutaredoxin-like protein [Anaerolineales bacterium]
MLTIKVLGSGCANCKRLEQLARKVVAELDVPAEVIKVTDPTQYADYGVLSTPGLVINEQTVSSGRIPSVAEITSFVTTALAASDN